MYLISGFRKVISLKEAKESLTDFQFLAWFQHPACQAWPLETGLTYGKTGGSSRASAQGTLDGRLLKILCGEGIFCGTRYSFSLSYHFSSEVLLAWFPPPAHAALLT